jgi:hypothetical protein
VFAKIIGANVGYEVRGATSAYGTLEFVTKGYFQTVYSLNRKSLVGSRVPSVSI